MNPIHPRGANWKALEDANLALWHAATKKIEFFSTHVPDLLDMRFIA